MKVHRFFGITFPPFCAALIFAALGAALSAALSACNQDPIFYTIAQEVAPLDPRIEGSPTNMVVIKRSYHDGTVYHQVPVMYVASSRLHWYARPLDSYYKGTPLPPQWDSSEHSIPQPGGKIVGLAAAQDHLYALCISGSGVVATLKRYDDSVKTWEVIQIDPGDSDANAYPLLQSIYADPAKGQLFAGSRKNPPERTDGYAILYVAGNTLKCLQKETGLLSGAVFMSGDYFLSTRGKGLYSVPDTFFSSMSPSGAITQLSESGSSSNSNRNFMGIINLHTKVVAVERGGTLFEVALTSPATFQALVNSSGSAFTLGSIAQGSLAVWQDKNNASTNMLLAGIGSLSTSTSTGYTYGYVEFDLENNGAFKVDGKRHEAGDNTLVTTPNNDRYIATIGKHPLNFIFQAPATIDDNMTLFASTQRAGLWSYRSRKDGEQWNAEE